MKTIYVISDLYKNQKVNFNGFIVNFNVEGKGIVEIEESKAEAFNLVFKMHPHIWEGDKIPDQAQIKNTQKQENKQEIATDSAELKFLKESNKKLAKEKLDLQKEVNELKEENASLKAKIMELEEQKKDINNQEQKEEQKEESQEQKEEKKDEAQEKVEEKIEEKVEEKNEEQEIKEKLNTKTVAQLKEILNSEDFLPFKEEWKGLKVKEDIVNYICNKIKNN